MKKTPCLKGLSVQKHPIVLHSRALRPRIHLGSFQCANNLLLRGPLHPLRHSIKCSAAPLDPDEYEIDAGYDSDDYELFEYAASAPRTAHHTPTGAIASSSSSYPVEVLQQGWERTNKGEFDTTGPSPAQNRRSTRQAIKSGFNIFLLFGAAIDRIVTRAQAAALAAGLAVLALIKRGVLAFGHQARGAGYKARQVFNASPAGKKIEKLSKSIEELQQELPEDTWGKLLWLWDRPPVQRIRLTVSMANLSIRLPALLALVATQVGLLASQVSLPMLAPLLLGTGMLLRSVKSNASFLLPRIGLLVVMLWMLWFINSVVHNTVAYLRKQNALDNRLAGGIITVSECSTLVVALVVVLSMLGVNVSALLLPAGIAVAVAAKDLSHNFLAGLFLFVVQPFKLGDRLSVSSSAPGAGGPSGGWFEGVCEKVDLRYTIVRQGRRKLMIPNSAFITREFMVMDDGPVGNEAPPPPPGTAADVHPQQFMTNDYRHVWQYVEGPPVHQELASAYSYPPPPPPQQQPMPPAMAGEGGKGNRTAATNSDAASNAVEINGRSSSGAATAPPGEALNGINGHHQQHHEQSSGAAAMHHQAATAARYPPYVINPGVPRAPQQPAQYYNAQGQPYRAPATDSAHQAITNGYWQQQQYQQPQQYRPINGSAPWSHPLSQEAWQQADDQGKQ